MESWPLHLRALKAMLGPSPMEVTEPEKAEEEAFAIAAEICALEEASER